MKGVKVELELFLEPGAAGIPCGFRVLFDPLGAFLEFGLYAAARGRHGSRTPGGGGARGLVGGGRDARGGYQEDV